MSARRARAKGGDGAYNPTQSIGLAMAGVIGGWLLKADGQSTVFFASSGLFNLRLYNRSMSEAINVQSINGLSRKMDFEQSYRSKRNGASDRAVSNGEEASPKSWTDPGGPLRITYLYRKST